MARSVVTWKGGRLEALVQLDSATKGSYNRLPQAVEQRYGMRLQNELFRTTLRIRNSRNEFLQELTQDLEDMEPTRTL